MGEKNEVATYISEQKNTVFYYITIIILLLYCIPNTLFYHRFHVSEDYSFIKHLP